MDGQNVLDRGCLPCVSSNMFDMAMFVVVGPWSASALAVMKLVQSTVCANLSLLGLVVCQCVNMNVSVVKDVELELRTSILWLFRLHSSEHFGPLCP